MSETTNSSAVAKREQFALPFVMDETANHVFTTVDITDKNGNVVGVSLKQWKGKDIAENYGLQPKKDADVIEAHKLEQSRRVTEGVRQWLASDASRRFNVTAMRARESKQGKSLNITFRETAKGQKSDFELAQAMWPDQPVEWLKNEGILAIMEMRDKQNAALKGKTIETETAKS